MSAIGGSRKASVIGSVDGNEVIGSGVTEDFQSSSITQEFSNSFILSINEGQVFTLQVISITNHVILDPNIAIGGETPISVSLTIIKLA